MRKFEETSQANTAKFLMSVSLRHEEDVRSLEHEIKLRVAQMRHRDKSSRDDKSRTQSKRLQNWRHNMNISRSRKMLDEYVKDKKQEGRFLYVFSMNRCLFI